MRAPSLALPFTGLCKRMHFPQERALAPDGKVPRNPAPASVIRIMVNAAWRTCRAHGTVMWASCHVLPLQHLPCSRGVRSRRCIYLQFPREKPRLPWVGSHRRLDCGPGPAGSVAWLSVTKLEKNLLMKQHCPPQTSHPEAGASLFRCCPVSVAFKAV